MSDHPDIAAAFAAARRRQAVADRIAESTLAEASKPFSPSRMYFECVSVVAERLAAGNPAAVRGAAAIELRHRWKDCGAEARARVIATEEELAEPINRKGCGEF